VRLSRIGLFIALCSVSPWGLTQEDDSKPILSDTASSEATHQVVSDPFSATAVAQLVLGLIFVIGLIFLLAWIAKRTLNLTQNTRQIRMIAGLPLGARERVVLIEVGKEQMLLGVAPGRVNLLTRFEEPVVDSDSAQPVFGQHLVDAIQQRRSDS